MWIKASDSIIIGDPTQINQLLMNLYANASHALRQFGGIIEILLEEVEVNADVEKTTHVMIPKLKHGTYIRLTVRDNGPGMDKGIIDRVFDPFFTTKGPGEGTGMGLSVVHGIAQSHGGSVTLESEPGKGAAFHCYLPLYAQTEKVVEVVLEKQVVQRGSEKILFVDDEEGIVDSFGQMLEGLGYEVVTLGSSLAALQLFEECPDDFDLVITDNTMPEMTGKVLAEKILQIRPGIPIILCTGFPDLTSKEELYEMGVKGLIIKPFSQEKISGLIRKMFDSA